MPRWYLSTFITGMIMLGRILRTPNYSTKYSEYPKYVKLIIKRPQIWQTADMLANVTHLTLFTNLKSHTPIVLTKYFELARLWWILCRMIQFPTIPASECWHATTMKRFAVLLSIRYLFIFISIHHSAHFLILF